MKKSVKILSALLAVVLVFTCGVGATLAYLHKETAEVKNTFSAKDLLEDPEDFQIWEHNVERNEANGEHKFVDPKEEVKQINYDRVTPGEVLPKDPFVRVKNIENAFLFVEIVNKLDAKMTYVVDESWVPVMKGEQQVLGDHGGLLYVKQVKAEGFDPYVLPARTEKVEFNILKKGQEVITVAKDFDPAAIKAGTEVSLSFWGYLTQYDATLNTPVASWEATHTLKLADVPIVK